MKLPYIFDIQRSSTVDGPGLRTVVFFKGCNLDCFWCHNPEGKSPLPEGAFFRERCVSCGTCQRVCRYTDCRLCGACTERCPENARRIYGRQYDVDTLVEFLLRDRPYYDATGGGVTFSGGECMLYPEFLACLAERCREEGISVAIDTAGCVPYSHFLQVLPFADLFLYDLKCIDPELHKKGTGEDNRLILENLESLRRDGARLIIRTPRIPDFNDGTEMERISRFCAERDLPHEILPYHTFGESKQNALSPPWKE